MFLNSVGDDLATALPAPPTTCRRGRVKMAQGKQKVDDLDSLVFISPPPDYIQLKCPICMQFLYENPHLITCCGQHICGPCVAKMSGPSNSACPFCKSTSSQKVPDKFFERVLDSLKVTCINSEEGCPWTGELKELTQHISVEGSCQYVTFPCSNNCQSYFSRSELVPHEQNLCHKRPATCQHCSKYKSTWEDVTNIHSKTCSFHPVPCDNGCGKIVRRKEMSAHTTSACPLRKITCKFKTAGCKWSNTEQHLAQHMEDSLKDHMILMFEQTVKQLQEQDEKIAALTKRIQKLESRPLEASAVPSEQKSEASKSTHPSDRLKMMSSKGTELLVHFHVDNSKEKMKFEIQDWAKKKKQGAHSQTFRAFSFGNGYRMQLMFYCIKGEYISMYMNILQTPDRRPFRGKIVIKLINPSGTNDKYGIFLYDDSVPNQYCLPKGTPLGIERFLAFGDTSIYITRNNSLLFELPQVSNYS